MVIRGGAVESRILSGVAGLDPELAPELIRRADSQS